MEGMQVHASSIRDRCIFYQNVTYGKHFKRKTHKCKSHGKIIHWKQPLIDNMKGGYFLIIAKKEGLTSYDKKLLIVDGSSQRLNNPVENVKYCPSGIVVLCICKNIKCNGKNGYT